MNKVEYNNFDKYCLNGVLFNAEFLSKQLKLDLEERVERIYEALQKEMAPVESQKVLLQPTKNSLRRSVEQLSLFENMGQCRGGSEWIIALFLNFKNKYPEVPTQKLLIEIAKLFAEGVGIQGAILQKLYKNPLLGHKQVIESLNCDFEEEIEWDLRNKDSSVVVIEILQKMMELKEGTYLLAFPGKQELDPTETIPGHATFIHIENKNYYLLDLNIGLAATGQTVGTENKQEDVGYLLAVCNQYSPLKRGNDLFIKGLEDLSTIIDNQEIVEIIRKTAIKFRAEGRACLNAYQILAIIEGLEKHAQMKFSKEQKREIRLGLCIRPGLMQVKLELNNILRLKKCILKIKN